MISGRDKTQEEQEEEQEYEDAIERELDEWDEMLLEIGHIPGSIPPGWDEQFEAAYVGLSQKTIDKTIDKEISLDRATPEEWQRFLDSLDEDVDA